MWPTPSPTMLGSQPWPCCLQGGQRERPRHLPEEQRFLWWWWDILPVPATQALNKHSLNVFNTGTFPGWGQRWLTVHEWVKARPKLAQLDVGVWNRGSDHGAEQSSVPLCSCTAQASGLLERSSRMYRAVSGPQSTRGSTCPSPRNLLKTQIFRSCSKLLGSILLL